MPVRVTLSIWAREVAAFWVVTESINPQAPDVVLAWLRNDWFVVLAVILRLLGSLLSVVAV